MQVRSKLSCLLLRGLMVLAALVVIVGFFAERQSIKVFCAGIRPGMSGDILDSAAEAKGFHLVDPPDGPAFVGASAAYLPFHFETCDLVFDSLLRHHAPVKSAGFEESIMPPVFWHYDMPTSIPFFVFVVCCNLLLGFYGNRRGFRIIGLIGACVSIAFLLLVIDHSNGHASPITGYGLSFDLIEYLGFATLTATLLSIALLLINTIEVKAKSRPTRLT